MTSFLTLVCLGLLSTLAILLFRIKKLADIVGQAEVKLAAAKQETLEVQEKAAAETIRLRSEAEQAINEAQKLIDQQLDDLRAESDRVRQHYETEARKITEALQTQLSTVSSEKEDLQRFAALRDTEIEVKQALSVALAEANALRTQAETFLAQARTAAEKERLIATERAKSIYQEADACLNQATRDAGRIVAEAEKRAKDIAGEAYDALRNKQLLEGAALAMRNIVDGYGDSYLKPTHSLLDDLAGEFGYTSAGESLKSARNQSRRMVEQGEAATCDYIDAYRRETAIRFVVDAFNGRVDAILSRVKRDNHGQLEQEIRDAFNLVNLNGAAFRDARIIDAYLNARLAELKWGVVVQELARKQMEEQREIKARIRDEEKARRDYEQKMREVAKEEELKRRALEEKEGEVAEIKRSLEHAAAQDRARLEQELAILQKANDGLRQDLAEATEKKLTVAQQFKKGTVYIISNIGAFGEGIYKIGQTRRLDPQERIDELGDASVPFDFDVHAWIRSDNAPALEHKLQKRFLAMQINKVNSRKEFFRVTLREIREEVEKLSQEEPFTVVHWTDAAAATQYRESCDIESTPEKLAKWLKRQEALADRELRLDSLRLSLADVTETDPKDTSP